MSEVIKCPTCGHSIDINKALSDGAWLKFEERKKELEIQANIREEALNDAFVALEKQRGEFEEILQLNTQKAIEKELATLEERIKDRAQKEHFLQVQALQKELGEKSKQISQFHLQSAQLEQLKRENMELEAKYKAEAQAQINEKLKLEKDSLAKTLAQENELKFRQKDDELNLLKQEQENLKASLKNERETIKKELEKENLSVVEALKKSLDEMSEKNILANKQLLEFENLKRDKAELESKFELEYAKKLNESLKSGNEELRRQIAKESELEIREKDIELERLKKNIADLKNIAQNRSSQLVGETQELAIEEYLRLKFPLDEISEVKKGATGADCLQLVNTRYIFGCGKIYYESKRTKAFQAIWIEKFKKDMREKGADVGILVTQTMPVQLDRMGLVDGVWVCSFAEFKGLCTVIRDGVIKLAQAKTNIQNRGEKMQMLYSYLTGNEFKMQVEAVLEAFVAMQNNLESEKRAMMKIWKSREKQIEKARDNAINMYGSLQGIAGDKIAKIDILELDYIAGDEMDANE